MRRADVPVLVRALAVDTALRAWRDAAGLTLAAAARIEPTYRASAVGCAVWAAARRRAGSSTPAAPGGAEPANRPAELSLAPALAPSPDGGVRAAIVGRVRF